MGNPPHSPEKIRKKVVGTGEMGYNPRSHSHLFPPPPKSLTQSPPL